MDYEKQYHEYLARVNRALEAACNTYLPEESEVCRAARYSLMSGGKRIRAVLVLSVCDMLHGNAEAAEQFAAAVEMLHCYSLIHDDLPCMDNDDPVSYTHLDVYKRQALILLARVGSAAQSVLSGLVRLEQRAGGDAYGCLLRCTGIVLLTDYARTLCEEAGAESLAWCASLAGRLLVLAAAWPLLEEIGQRIWSVLG